MHRDNWPSASCFRWSDGAELPAHRCALDRRGFLHGFRVTARDGRPNRRREALDTVLLAPLRGCLAGLFVMLASCTDGPGSEEGSKTDPRNQAKVELGAKVYKQYCASCHGAKLEGQPEWRSRLPNGRLPAPPHDDSGHTWHHPDAVLFGITKSGLVPPYAPQGYESDMPAFGGQLSDDDIWAVLAYIKSHWGREVLEARSEITRNVRQR